MTAIVVNSRAVAESAQRMKSIAAERLRVIPNGMVLPRHWIRRSGRRRGDALISQKDAFVIAYLAHFRTGKGHVHLPKLAAELLHTVPNATILVAGDMESTRDYSRNARRFRARRSTGSASGRRFAPSGWSRAGGDPGRSRCRA